MNILSETFIQFSSHEQARLEFFASLIKESDIKKGELVLDIGAGIGNSTACLVSQSGRPNLVVPVDISPEHRKNLIQHFGLKDSPFVCCDSRYPPFSDNCLDMAASYMTLKFLYPRSERFRMLYEKTRVTKTGGRVITAEVINKAGNEAEKNYLMKRELVRKIVKMGRYVKSSIEPPSVKELLNSYRRLGLRIVKNEILERREDILVKDSEWSLVKDLLNDVERAIINLHTSSQTELKQTLENLRIRAKKYGVKFPSVILLIGIRS